MFIKKAENNIYQPLKSALKQDIGASGPKV